MSLAQLVLNFVHRPHSCRRQAGSLQVRTSLAFDKCMTLAATKAFEANLWCMSMFRLSSCLTDSLPGSKGNSRDITQLGGSVLKRTDFRSVVWCACAVGDIHGDVQKAITSLKLGGVLVEDSCGRPVWCGGNTVVVQLGDVLDRGDSEIGEAPSAGPREGHHSC